VSHPDGGLKISLAVDASPDLFSYRHGGTQESCQEDVMSGSTYADRTSVSQGMGTLAGIWGAVLVISLFAPDLVSGSEHQHLPIAAFGTWLWGAAASRSVMRTLLRLDGEAGGLLAGFVAATWTVAAVVAIFGPQMITGSDPTRLPIAALLAPVAASVLTMGACEAASAFASQQRR
jgi:hypothetical protein